MIWNAWFKGVLRGKRCQPVFSNEFDSLNRWLSDWQFPPLQLDPRLAETSQVEATLFIVALLLSRPDIRRRFPRVLSDGPDKKFNKWIAGKSVGLSVAGLNQVRTVLRERPGKTVHRVYELRVDVREAFILGLTPHRRIDYLNWLMTHGLDEFRVHPEQALWYFAELAEDSSYGLVTTYRMTPSWQAAVPHGLTRFGWAALKKWIASEYSIDARWLAQAALPKQFEPWDEICLLHHANADKNFPHAQARAGDARAVLRWIDVLPDIPRSGVAWRRRLAKEIRGGAALRRDINVLGFFRYTSGLQQAVRHLVDAAHRGGIRTSLRDLPVAYLREPRDLNDYRGLELFDVTILNTGLDMPVLDAYRRSGVHPRKGVYRIGIWWWEMESVPDKWLDRADDVDEVWAPTRFIADAYRKAFRKPVYPMLPGLELPRFAKLPRSHFGLRDDRFLFSFVFDINSSIERKNPLGLIRAFRMAFGPELPVDLAIKVTPPENHYLVQWAELREAVSDAGVYLIDRVLTREELLGFLDASDAYVSLHRSEGLGLTCAEAMLLGKPVIATGYSGNMDFMTPENSYLVDSEPAVLTADINPYPKGGIWANPDLACAARQMLRVYENRVEASERAQRGKADCSRLLSLEEAGKRVTMRLDEIYAGLRSRDSASASRP